MYSKEQGGSYIGHTDYKLLYLMFTNVHAVVAVIYLL